MRKILAVALAAMSIAAAGCGGGDQATAPESGVAGTYILQTMNGKGAPFITSQDATYQAEILSWSFTLKDDKTFSWTADARETDNGVTSGGLETSTGTYTLAGSTIKMFDPSDNSMLEGTLTGSTLTVTIDAPTGLFTFVFKR